LEAQILDYDLVRQVKDEMNKVKVFRGVYDSRFIGSSQHETATHVLRENEAPTDSEALKCLRADIRYFKWRNGVVGHTTVIWSASVEPNCNLLEAMTTASDLLDAIEMSAEERGGPLPPSLLYATAALLEGCSFINGGSQNTLACPGLTDLARQQLGVYCLGTDFKAGQTKFKTAALEYIRTMGLTPRVIASSNHLGNNDMRNLASNKTAATAKLRVKHDIFSPWQEEDLDHKVSIMFTPHINDEKRDFVEYTSLGFLGQPHTMVTYTRASDSVLCVPLMIDGAVWCDYFSSRSWPYDKVAKSLAYLFKVPEGAAKGVDPGFFRQMQELDTQVMAAHNAKSGGIKRENSTKKRVRIRPEEKTTEWAIPHDARIVCAGLACVDMQLNQASGGDGGESIETFEGEKSMAGGSVSMACKTLARLCHGEPLDGGYMQVTPPVVYSVVPLCKIGNDDTGDKLISLLEKCGEACRNVETKYIKAARDRDSNARTALAVLPIYKDGRRGCFFDAASNSNFSAREVVEMMGRLSSGTSGPSLDTSHMSADDIDNYHADLEQMTPICGAFLFGYPHLLPRLQGESLAQILLEARSTMIEGGIIALDLNGVPENTFEKQGSLRSVADLRNDPVIGAALEHTDILHLNEDELMLLTGCEIVGTRGSELQDDYNIASAVNLFLLCGVAVVAVTRGQEGAFVCCNDVDRFRRSSMLPASWVDCTAKVGSVKLPPGTIINGNGAGDAFTSGLLVASMLRHTGMTVPTKGSDEEHKVPPIISDDSANSRSPASNKKKKNLTPYTLYMRENYVTLKKKCNDDKKAIFSMCHEMWENESNDVKTLYERKANEENEEGRQNETALTVITGITDDMELLDSTPKIDTSVDSMDDAGPRNLYMTNRSLNLESAVQFASLVAAYHIDVSTRDRAHIDLSRLLDKAIVFPATLEEI
jgi:myo-inositol-1-phosphate synthase/sugar/nucleoside kinase (ribokinase family)